MTSFDPFGRPDLVHREAVAEVAGQVRAQRDRVPVRVAVEAPGDGRDSVRDGLLQGGAGAVGVLVGVQLVGDVELRGSVGHACPAGRPGGAA